MGVNTIPISGVVDANVGVNLAGSAALAFASTTLTVGGAAWTTALQLQAGLAGSVILSPARVDTYTLTRATNVVQLQADTAATSVTVGQAILASGTGASLTLSAQSSSAVGAGGALNLQSGSGAATNGVITLQPGGGACLSLSKSGNTASLSLDSALSSFAVFYSATSSSSGGSLSFTAQTGVSGGTGGSASFSAGGAAGAGIGGSLTLGSGPSVTNGVVSLKVGNFIRLQLDAVGNLVTVGAASGVVGGMVGGVSLGTVTTTPTSSASGQVQMWNNAGMLSNLGWSGLSFLCPPAGQGAGAPKIVAYFGLGGERSEAANIVPEVFDDFVTFNGPTGYIGNTNWQINVSGGSTVASVSSVDASHIQLLTASATGSAGIYTGNPMFNVNGNDFVVEVLINITALSTSIQEYTVVCGMSDTYTLGSAAPANGLWIQYLRTTSVNWLFGSGVAGTTSLTASAVAVATGWAKLRIVKIGTTTTYSVNGTVLGTKTNVPLVGMGVMHKCESLVGTSGKVVLVDYTKHSMQLGIAR